MPVGSARFLDPGADYRMVIVGGGGHAKVVIELARALGFDLVGCTDPGSLGRTVAGLEVIGDDSVLEGLHRDGVALAAVALGNNAIRLRIGLSLQASGFRCPPLISPAATVSSSVSIGEGVVIMPGAVVNSESRLGDFAIINTSASVDHDGEIGAGAHIGPGSHLSGCVKIGARALVGVGATVLPGIAIGPDAVLGGGSVAIADIAAGDTAAGSPARVISRS